MRIFKILVIAHSLKQNKIAKYGETVSESQLTSPASELIEAGFIKEVFDVKKYDSEELIPEKENEEVFDVKKEIKDIKKPINKK